jgi:hypothetical protein
LDEWFQFGDDRPLIDQIMGGWVPATDGGITPPNTSIDEIKAYVTAARANVLGQIQQNYSLNVTTSGTTSEGFSQNTDGSASFNGTFNVARTYSITVNGQLAQWFYRPSGPESRERGGWQCQPAAGASCAGIE